jgi:hypothetical protein
MGFPFGTSDRSPDGLEVMPMRRYLVVPTQTPAGELLVFARWAFAPVGD